MKIIVITSPDKMPGEVSTICRLLDDGIDSIHIRKPDWNETQCRELIEAIPEQYRCQLVLHQYFELCEEYHLKGIHLNKRHSYPPVDHKGTISCSWKKCRTSYHPLASARRILSNTRFIESRTHTREHQCIRLYSD